MGKSDQLQTALAESKDFSPSETGAVAPCRQAKKKAIEIEVAGEDGRLIEGIRVELLSGGKGLYDQTGPKAPVRLEGLLPAGYTLSLYDLDQDLWELVSAFPLEKPESTQDASWSAALASAADGATVHTVQSGECFSSIAFQYGFFPESLWALAENKALRKLRKDMNILYPADEVHIPKRRKKNIPVAPGYRYRLRLKGIPEVLKLRFLDADSRPRAGLPYLLTIVTRKEETLKAVQAKTNGQGMLIKPIPPHADRATLLVGAAPDIEKMIVPIGRVCPVDTDDGIWIRLANLGYFCGDPPGAGKEWTLASIEQFQADNGLEVTGEADEPTKAKLIERHLS